MDKNLKDFFVELGRGVILPSRGSGTQETLAAATDNVFEASVGIRMVGKTCEIHLSCWALYVGNFLRRKLFQFSL